MSFSAFHRMTSPGREGMGGTTHIAALDGLRGVAILMVLLFHFWANAALVVGPSTLLLDRAVAAVSEVGWAGVDLFFVLSGFLITGILFDARRNTHFFRNFYARRVLRIVPIYYGLLLFLIVLLPVLPWMRDDAGLRLLSKHQLWYWTYLLNLWVCLRPVTDIGLYGNGHVWSLCVEEQFYLIWPILVFLAGRRGLQVICWACIIGALLIRIALTTGIVPGLTSLYVPVIFTPARLDALALGGLLALVARAPNQLAAAGRWAWPAAGASLTVLMAIVVVRGGLSPLDPLVQTVGFTFTAVFFGAVLTLAITAPSVGSLHRVLTHRILRMFGRYSYALYLFHLQLATWLLARFNAIGAVPTLMGSAIPGRLAFTTIAMACSLSLAWLSWHLYERRFLELKRFFPYDHGQTVAGRPGGE